MVYNTVSFMGLPVLIAAKLFNCKAVSIIADLPIKCSNFNILHRIEGRTEILLIKYFDGIIPITRQIQEDFAPTKPFIVIEGGHESQICSSAIKPISLDLNVKKVIFSGALNNLSGIELLLEAFSKISRPEYQLHIYGSGEKAFIVEDYVRKDSRIQYHGFIDNARIIEKQERADLLVSPRLPDNYITKYTFPSKVLEYIFSGIPVLSNDLPGLPDEYADFINIAPTHDSDEWAKQIVEITEDKSGTFRQKAIKARLAAEAKKSWSFQASQINEFLKGLLTKLD